MEVPDEVLAWAIAETRTWIEQQRDLHRPAGGELPSVAKDAVRPFFPPAVLDSARVAVVPAIPNPLFLGQARDLGLPVAGIDFREYEILGLEEFSRQYVRGIVDGDFDYYRIPLEVMAYDLGRRFADNPGATFSVHDEVRRRLLRCDVQANC